MTHSQTLALNPWVPELALKEYFLIIVVFIDDCSVSLFSGLLTTKLSTKILFVFSSGRASLPFLHYSPPET